MMIVNLNQVNCCQENNKQNSPFSLNELEGGFKSKARTISRFWRIFLYYCGPGKIDDDKLLAAEKCSLKKLLVSLLNQIFYYGINILLDKTCLTR